MSVRMINPVGIPFTQKGAANGVATLDGTGKIPSSQISLDTAIYQGTWDANANTPALASGVGTSGYYYLVSVAGITNLDGITDWQIGDRAIFEGTVWQKVDSTDAPHLMGSAQHIADTFANLNVKVSDATLVPAAHGHTGGDDGAILNQIGPLNIAAYGTVTVAIGTPNVVGAGTYFTFEYVGAQLLIAGETHTILSIADDAHLTLVANHVAGAAGVPYYTENRNVVHGTDALKTGAKWDYTAYGYKALEKVVDEKYNSAFGAGALMSNTTGNSNNAFGWRALVNNIASLGNSAFGNSALEQNVDGEYNTGIGVHALRNNISGHGNVAIGYAAGYYKTDSNKLYIANNRGDEDILIYGDFATRMLGFGTLSPTAGLHLKGVLTDVLTGTVSVTISTAAVVGVGTAFDTELAIGDAIKIADEIFTVQAITDALNLTLDSNHVAGASGVTAYRDPDLYKIQTGDGSDRVVVTKSGFVYLTSDVYFANTTHYLGSMIPGSNIKIYASTAVGAIQLRNTIQTPDAPMLLTGSLANHWIICEHADEGVDFGFPQQVNPTLCIQSADATTPAQRVTLAHNQTDGVVAVGAGDLDINCPAQKTLALGTPVWDDLRVPLTRGAVGVGNPPTFAQFMDDGAGSVGVNAYSFAYQAVAGNEEQIYFEVQLPHDYKEGTDIKGHIHWSPAVSGAAGEFVKWGLEYTWINIDGTFGVTTIATSDASSAATATTSGDGTLLADKHYTTEIGADIAGTGKLISSMLVCRLFRNSSHADDDLVQAAFGIEFDFHYQKDTMGSRQELVK